MTVDISDIEHSIAQQDTWRQTQTINLIASENTPSEAVRRVQISDFRGRYAEGHPNEGDKVNRSYQGTRDIDEIERMATQEILYHLLKIIIMLMLRKQLSLSNEFPRSSSSWARAFSSSPNQSRKWQLSAKP